MSLSSIVKAFVSEAKDPDLRKIKLEKCLKNGIPLIDMGLEFHESQAGHVLLVDN